MPAGHIDPTKPLKPLSDHAWVILERMDLGVPMKPHTVNSGVWNRLLREDLVKQVSQGFQSVMVITQAGRDKVAERRGAST